MFEARETDKRPPSSFNQLFNMSLGYFNSSKVTAPQLDPRKERQEERRNENRYEGEDKKEKGKKKKGGGDKKSVNQKKLNDITKKE